MRANSKGKPVKTSEEISNTKRRVASVCAAAVLSLTCVAANFIDINGSKDSVVNAESNKAVFRSSYNGDYEVGKTYYDVGSLYGHAYYNTSKGWVDDESNGAYQRNGWKIYDVKSFLDSDGDGHDDKNNIVNTLPYTTDINDIDSEALDQELSCWQSYSSAASNRTRYLERTDVTDYCSSPYIGEDTPAFYVAKGTVTENKDTGEVYINWKIRSWVQDSNLWLQKGTFSDTDLTGLSKNIVDSDNDNVPDLDRYFGGLDSTVANTEIQKFWDKADFESDASVSKSFTFGSTVNNWWDGVSAAIYQMDVKYDGTYVTSANSNGNSILTYRTNIEGGSVKDIAGNEKSSDVFGYYVRAKAVMDSTGGYTLYNGESTSESNRVTDGHRFYNVANTLKDDPVDDIIMNTVGTDLSKSKTSVSYNNTNSVFGTRKIHDANGNIKTVSKVTGVDLMNPSKVKLYFKYSTLAKYFVNSQNDSNITYSNGKVRMKGTTCNAYFTSGKLTTKNPVEQTTTGTNGNPVTTTVYEDYKNDQFYDIPMTRFSSTFLENLVKSYAKSNNAWLFDDNGKARMDDILSDLKLTNVTEAEKQAMERSVNDMSVSITALTPSANDNTSGSTTTTDSEDTVTEDTMLITFDNIAFSDSTSANAAHATNFPITYSGIFANLVNMADSMKSDQTVYISTGYQRAGGDVVAKRVKDTPPEESSSTPDSSSKPDESSSTPDSSSKPDESSSTPDSSSKPDESSSTPDSSSKPDESSSTPDSSSKPDESSSTPDITPTPTPEPEPTTPTVKTTAISKVTGNHTVELSNKAVIVDRVSFTGLDVGEKYTIVATPYDKATGKPVEGVNSVKKEFTAVESNGYVDVEITVDSTKLSGDSIVMFESIKKDDKEIAGHKDIEDENQTVTVLSIKTEAKSDGKHKVDANAKTNITDTVKYTGLTVGTTYKFTGKVVNANDAKKAVQTKTVVFKPKKSDGSVKVDFTIDTIGHDGDSYVCFEDLSQKIGNKYVDIGSHRDINDKKQTVSISGGSDTTGGVQPVTPPDNTTVEPSTTPTTTNTPSATSAPSTGDTTHETRNKALALGFGTAFMGCLAYVVHKIRRKKDK